MDYDKIKDVSLFKGFGTVAVLRCTFRPQHRGGWLYLTPELVDLLGLKSGRDDRVLAFVTDDADSEYRFVTIVKENFVADKLRPLLLDLKQEATSRLEEARKLAESIASSENATGVSSSNSV